MSSCFAWTGHIAENGYGRRWSSLHKKMSSAHRVAWEKVHGPIPSGRVIMHTCDNRSCVNLDHLVCGTQAENIQDMVRKKRRRWDGEHGPNARLTWDEVNEIRASSASGAELGRQYGIHRAHANAIKRGTTWVPAST